MKPITLVNNDGTSIDDYPVNPLIEKWEKKFPKDDLCKRLDEENIVNYSCIDCGKCYEGDLFEVPKEDKKSYRKYLKKVYKYNEIHNSNK